MLYGYNFAHKWRSTAADLLFYACFTHVLLLLYYILLILYNLCLERFYRFAGNLRCEVRVVP